MGKKVIDLGFYDSGTGKHQSNTVYSNIGIMPTITTITGGGTIQQKVVRKLDIEKSDNIIATNERTNERTGSLYSERLAIPTGEQRQRESAECQRISTGIEVSHQQRAAYGSKKDVSVLGNMMSPSNVGYAGYRVYSISGISPCLCASGFKREVYVCRKKY